MRVLIANRGVVALRTGSGGAEQAAYQLARQLAADGVLVTLVTDTGEDLPIVDGLEIVPLASSALHRVQALPGGFFRWLLQHLIGNVVTARVARGLLREGGYDLVHVHGALTALLVARKTTLPLVYTEHDATPWSCRYRRWWERSIRRVIYRTINVRAFRRVDCVSPVFAALRDELIERWGIPAAKIVTITNGTDIDIFNPDRPGISLVREQYGLESYCVFVGRLTMRKAPDLLLRTLPDCPGLNCAFVGDGPLRKKLEALAAELGVRDRVAFTGNVEPALLGRIYADADFLVLPSVSEGTPLVVLEALACGTPVLATRVSGSPALVRDWETGFLVRPGDLGELSMAVRFLAGDPELRRKMGENGRELVQTSFLWSVLSRQYIALYEELVGRDESLEHELTASSGLAGLTS
ncbi:MAG: glycosyltransferase family 4 protein [Gaiellaceae bacterium]